MNKKQCLRCGFDEFSGSLHVHHLDENHNNNNSENIITLCSNCHFSLHHGKWRLIDIGIIAPEKNKKQFKRKYSLKKELLLKIEELLSELDESNSKINELNDQIKNISDKYDCETSKYRKKILKMYEIVRKYDYELYYDLRDLE